MEESRYAFTVAVVGSSEVMTSEELSLLVQALVNRHRDDRRIWLLSAGNDSPDLKWGHDLDWTVFLEHRETRFKRDCALVAAADAVIVLGDPAPWGRLLQMCREARIPTRVYRERPKVPPRPTYYNPLG